MFGFRMKRTSGLIVLLTLIVATMIGFSAQAQGGGTALTPGQPVAGALNNDTIAQVFTFESTGGEAVTLVANNTSGLALALLLTDAKGSLVAQARDVNASGETRLSTTTPTAGTYYVTVLPVGGVQAATTGAYQLTLTTDATPEATVVPGPEATAEIARQVVTRSGIQVKLDWGSSADMNLEVRDPVGNSVYFGSPTSNNGATYGTNVNGNCVNLVSDNPSENVAWAPGGVPAGSYEVLVYYQQECQQNGTVAFTVNVTFDGTALTPISGSLQPGQVFVTSFVVNADGTATLSGRSGVNGQEQLPAPAADIVANAKPIDFNTRVSGVISNQQPYQSYSFTATANEVVSIDLNSTSGSLDTYLALLDPAGGVVYFNDDRAFRETNSALNGSLLAVPGTYTIVATRYGLTLGGTEGGYVLSLTRGANTGTVETSTQVATTAGTTEQVGTLPASVQSLALPAGNIAITLVWNTQADLRVIVRDPAGDTVFVDKPSIRSGGRLEATGNLNCQPTQPTPVDYTYWPTNITPRAGSYEIDVWFKSECNDTTPINFTLYTTVNGQQVINRAVTPAQPFLLNDHYITGFSIGDTGAATEEQGGIAGLNSLQWQAEAASATVVTAGQTVSGSITPTNKFDLYSFQGKKGQRVSIALTHGEGTVLDPKLYLIGPSGTTAAENDDAVVGTNRDSLINNFTLPSDGQYIIIATHYGEQFGITSGAYNLTFNQSG